MDNPKIAIELRDVSAGYPGRTVLAGLTVGIRAGRSTAVVGPNGAGKSTLLDVLAGIRPTTSGTVRRATRCRPAYVLQRSEVPDAMPVTVRAAVAMGRWARAGFWRRLRAEDHRIVDDCLRRLALHDLADRTLGTLSGGQRQRTFVAQGLAQQADLLLLDEPAAGLDVDAQCMIDDALEQVCADGAAVVRITHDLRVAERADRCLVLAGGRLVAEGAGLPLSAGLVVGPSRSS